MENKSKNPKKSLFISKQIRDLNNKEKRYIKKLNKVLNNQSQIETIRINGFFVLTHFETETKGDINLKRLLKRGNAISRGPSIGL